MQASYVSQEWILNFHIGNLLTEGCRIPLYAHAVVHTGGWSAGYISFRLHKLHGVGGTSYIVCTCHRLKIIAEGCLIQAKLFLLALPATGVVWGGM